MQSVFNAAIKMEINMNDTDRIKDHHISGLVKANLDQIEKLQRNKGPVLTGLPTGFTYLDRITSGLNNSDLIILASCPKFGKTALALNIAKNVAVDQRVPVFIFSLEFTAEQLSMRMLSMESRVSGVCVKKGNLEEGDWDRIKKTSYILSEAPIYIDASPGISISDISYTISGVENKAAAGLVIIDYFQLIKSESGSQNRRIELAEMANDLKRLARKLDIPILLLFQLDIDMEDRRDKRPTLIDLANAGSFDQDADLVLFIYRDEVYYSCAEPCNRGRAEIIIAKNKKGSTGSACLNFYSLYGLFTEIAHD